MKIGTPHLSPPPQGGRRFESENKSIFPFPLYGGRLGWEFGRFYA